MRNKARICVRPNNKKGVQVNAIGPSSCRTREVDRREISALIFKSVFQMLGIDIETYNIASPIDSECFCMDSTRHIHGSESPFCLSLSMPDYQSGKNEITEKPGSNCS